MLNSLISGVVITLFTLNFSVEIKASSVQDEKTFKGWITADLKKALGEAEASKSFTLLYWGAVWCPPCNELKKNVFAHPNFEAATQNIVKVYIDGDHDNAQLIADQYQVSGYPTILILNPKGQEILRLAESLNYQQFLTALETSIGTTNTIDDILTSIKNGNSISKENGLLLAYSRPNNAIDRIWNKDKVSAGQTLLKFAFSQPAPDDAKAKLIALGASTLLQSNSELPPNHSANEVLFSALEEIFKPENNWILGSKDLIIWNANSGLKWLNKMRLQTGEAKYLKMSENWARMSKTLQDSTSVTTDYKLWAIYPTLLQYSYLKITDISKLDLASSELTHITEGLKAQVRRAVTKADTEAASDYARQATISGAASLLFKIGDKNQALEMLTEEAKKSSSPWYYVYYKGLLESRLQNWASSLKNIRKASELTKGTASKIQWLTAEFTLIQKIEPSHRLYDTAIQQANNALQQTYALTFSTEDGFSGRNKARLERIKSVLTGDLDQKKISVFLKTYAKYGEMCTKLTGRQDTFVSACKVHFSLEPQAKKS